jgi:hypothetical protein
VLLSSSGFTRQVKGKPMRPLDRQIVVDVLHRFAVAHINERDAPLNLASMCTRLRFFIEPETAIHSRSCSGATRRRPSRPAPRSAA